MGNQKINNFRKNRKSNLIQIKGGNCCICGFNAFQEALEFHHMNPEEKEYQLSSGNCHSLEKDLVEVRKCALVCSNCHKGVHAGYLEIPEQWDYIDEELINTLFNKNSIVEPSKIEVNKAQHPSKEELKKLIRMLSFVQIGKQFKVSDNAVRKWCIKYSLPNTKKEINSYSDEKWNLL